MSFSFNRVLIANRGEIAVRIIRACQDLGLQTVAVYAGEDRNALHVRMADDAFKVSGASAVEAYLDVDSLIGIAKRANADAIHPGYGFLAENADAAQAFIDAGLIWVGPPPSAMRAVGDKVSARKIAMRVNAPVAPGTPDAVSDVSEIEEFAAKFGLPIAIKAANGGGGRGMRVVRTTAEIADQFASAAREASAAFGSGVCFVERFLERPRHIETQCLADHNGKVVVLSTRDCTVQRRHQKLIEEAPAPFLTDEQNQALIEASKNILREAGYRNAATCEFLLAEDGTLAFLEVNSRLQVEHPVTEQVTGIDIVCEQFRIANGEKIDYDDPTPTGHSIEFRINSEDPSRNFLPTPGKLEVFEMASGPGVRVDTGVTQGDVVTGSFDSLLAKLIVTGASRRQAIARAKRALAQTKIKGLPTVIGFHQKVLDAPEFVGDDHRLGVHTGWAEEQANLELPIEALDSDDLQTERRRELVVEVDGRRLEVSVPAELVEGVRPRSIQRRSAPSKVADGDTNEGVVVAPMKGTVIKVTVRNGQQVAKGEVVAVVEAMKMEQPLHAPRNGEVVELAVSEGESVSAGAVLMRIDD